MTALVLIGALLLDALFGEPKWLWDRLPHPIVLIGRLIDWLDKRFNTGPNRKLMGIAVMIALSLGAIVLGGVIAMLPFGWLLQLILAAILIAQHSLAAHVKNVADALRLSLADGRNAVARIVGRDTSQMDAPAVSRAAIESAAENFSDGVVAPAFWFLIGGLPGILLYKVTNTADSMIGYMTPKHQDFGWAAARFDDLLNWAPARLTAVIFAIVGRCLGDWSQIAKDAKLHRSPNAGWPESAMSRGLGVALAGPRSYDGVMTDYPFVNPSGKTDTTPKDIDTSVTHLWGAWALMIGGLLLISAVFTAI